VLHHEGHPPPTALISSRASPVPRRARSPCPPAYTVQGIHLPQTTKQRVPGSGHPVRPRTSAQSCKQTAFSTQWPHLSRRRWPGQTAAKKYFGLNQPWTHRHHRRVRHLLQRPGQRQRLRAGAGGVRRGAADRDPPARDGRQWRPTVVQRDVQAADPAYPGTKQLTATPAANRQPVGQLERKIDAGRGHQRGPPPGWGSGSRDLPPRPGTADIQGQEAGPNSWAHRLRPGQGHPPWAAWSSNAGYGASFRRPRGQGLPSTGSKPGPDVTAPRDRPAHRCTGSLLVLLIVTVLHPGAVGGTTAGSLRLAELAVAFVVGFFPLVGLQALQRVTSRALRWFVPPGPTSEYPARPARRVQPVVRGAAHRREASRTCRTSLR